MTRSSVNTTAVAQQATKTGLTRSGTNNVRTTGAVLGQQRSAILLSFQHDASAELRKRFGHSYQTSREVCPYRRLSASQGVLLEAYFVYDFSWGGRDGVTRSRHIVYVLSAPRDQTFASVAAF